MMESHSIGQVFEVSAQHGKNTTPRIACADHGCFVVWDNEKGGAFAAYVKKGAAETMWRRELAARGFQPAIAAAPNGDVAAWFEG
jgi:hypothetical protein